MNAPQPFQRETPAEDRALRQQHARWAAWLCLAAITAGTLSLINNIGQGTAPRPWWPTALADGLALALTLLSLWLNQRGRLTAGVGALIAASLGVVLITAFQTAGLGVMLAVVTLVVITAIAGLTLRPPWRGRAIAGAVVTASLTILIDVFGPADRPPDLTLGLTLAVAGALLAAAGFLVLRQYRHFNLRAKLALTSVTVTVLAVAGVAFLAERVVQQNIESAVGANLHSLAQAQAAALGNQLSQAIGNLNSLSLNPLVRASVQAANAGQTEPAAALQARDMQWQIAAGTATLIQAVLNDPAALELRRYQALFPDNAEIFVTNRAGVVVAATARPAHYYYGAASWWLAASQGRSIIDQPRLGMTGSVFGLDLAAPIRSEDGREVLGSLHATYDLRPLTDILATARFGSTGHADVLLPDGQALSLTHAADAFDAEVRAQLQALTGAGYGQIQFSRQPHLVSQAPVTSLNPSTAEAVAQLGWQLIADQEAADALLPVTTITRLFVLIGLGASLAAGLAALLVAQTLAGPITRLTTAAARVAAGDLEAQAAVETADEIGSLARTFNTMTGQLRDTLRGLEARVAERTRDLELAAEVGQSLTSLRDLDALLAEAVENIRARFDLYYAQIYLLDPARRVLVMQAGTGSVGAELKQRGFRLPVNAGSINGTAVLERRAVIVADTARSAIFRPNALLPRTRSEMAIPLVAGDRVVGVLDMQGDRPNLLSADNLPAFQTLAGQLAVAIENARLFQQAEAARADLQAQARRLTHAGWESFLNAIDRGERLTSLYAPLLTPEVPAAHTLAVPIVVTGEPVGQLQLESEVEWTELDRSLVVAVAQQVAQQVENLRLLAQAEQYRAETEQTLRRLTRTGWRDFLEAADPARAFEYAEGQVQPAASVMAGPAARPLLVQGEPIGEISLEAPAASPDIDQVLAVVAAQLSAHIENLRLGEATQLALAQTEELYRLTGRLNEANSLTETLGVAAGLDQAAAGALFLAETDAAGRLQALTYHAGWPRAEGTLGGSGLRFAAAAHPELIDWGRRLSDPLLVEDIEAAPDLPAAFQTLLRHDELQAGAFLPLTLAGQSVGLLLLAWPQVRRFTGQDQQLYRAAAAQLAVVFNNQVLFEQTRKRADREAVINAINQKVQSAATVEAALQTAAQEIGKLLKVQRTVAQLGRRPANGVDAPPGTNGHSSDPH